MKKFIYCFIFILIFFLEQNLQAQGFTYTNLGPVYVQYPHYPDSVQVIQRRSIVANNSSADIKFKFARIVSEMPQGWYTQMCYDLCYAPEVDTISLPGDSPYVITPSHIDTLFYIDFTCAGAGTGTAIVRMYNAHNPVQYVQDTFIVQIGGVGITPISSLITDYQLSQNYPNPFNPSTYINFSVPKSQKVSLNVYNVLGNKVKNLIDGQALNAGTYRVDFNGERLSSGIYYYTLETENFVDTKKMILLK